MSRRSRRARSERAAPASPKAAEPSPPSSDELQGPSGFWNRRRAALAVCLLLVLHFSLAVQSLVRENPTVDEAAHLPAGVTYWQKRTFRLYPHNPPLIKLVAALPVVLSGPATDELYQQPSWTSDPPSQATFSQTFALRNTEKYFELFNRARIVMPLFSVLGGLVVYAWSSRLYGTGGGLLSLALWCLCPNILAHCRLVTTDLGASALGVAATYVFWRYLRAPCWRWALAAGLALGVAQLAKFSMLLLYGIWPMLWIIRLLLTTAPADWPARVGRGMAHGVLVVAVSLFTIDAGYLFEGVGRPLGRYEFASSTLTRPLVPPGPRKANRNELLWLASPFRVNRFRGTWLDGFPAPLPMYYLRGFDEQKLESEGLPAEWYADPAAPAAKPPEKGAKLGYPVYLDGEMRKSGWWYYYLLTLAYKVPEGTWVLVLLSIWALLTTRRSREAWADEIALWSVPVVVLFTMSLFTDINLGLRYVLPIAPYVFIAAGKVVPWAAGLRRTAPRRLAWGVVGGALAATGAAVASIHPHYLAYFNAASGGPDREPAHLIDSNLDWGQDLANLQRWVLKNAPAEPIGLAYFGQFNPSIFTKRGEGFFWFLPPARAGTMEPMPKVDTSALVGPPPRLKPGLYAISASLVYGLPWRLYDSSPQLHAWGPTWNAHGPDAFGYFRSLQPIARIGHSIYIYHVTERDAQRLAPIIGPPIELPNRPRD